MIPKISIIMPAYNAEKKIKNTIQSVIEQSFGQWELIIVNDTSTDNTLKIIEDFIKKDTRIKVINKTLNERAFHARLDGVALAESEWICFLDADDYLYSNALEKLMFATDSDCKIVIGSYCRSYDRFGITRSKPINLLPDRLIEGERYINGEGLNLSLAFYGKHSIPVTSWGKLISRDLFYRIAKEDLPKIHYFDDTLLNLLLFEQVEKVFFIKDKIVDYRYGGGTSKIDDKILHDLNELFKIRNSKIEENFSEEKKKYSDIEYFNTIYYHFLNALIIGEWGFEYFCEDLKRSSKLEIFDYLKNEFPKYNNERFNLFFSSLQNNPRFLYDSLSKEAKKNILKRKILRKVGFLLSKI